MGDPTSQGVMYGVPQNHAAVRAMKTRHNGQWNIGFWILMFEKLARRELIQHQQFGCLSALEYRPPAHNENGSRRPVRWTRPNQAHEPDHAIRLCSTLNALAASG